MSMTDITQLEKNVPVLREIRAGNEVFWMNPEKSGCDEAMRHIELTMEDVEDAERRLQRFAPFIRACFPETEETGGLIESALTPIPGMKALLNERYGSRLQGALLLKQDSHLAIAGSVKARGGIYEVLKHTEELALEHGLLTPEDSYERLSSEECRQFFRQYTIQSRPEHRHHERRHRLSGHRTHVGRREAVEKGASAEPRRHGPGIRGGLQ